MTSRPEGIVVLGAPRSGTTLVRRILDAHPSLACPGETHLLTACARFLEGEPTVDGLEVGVLNGLGFAGFDEDDVVGRLREFAFGFRREHAKSAGAERWVEKTAVDAFHVDAIERLCGDAVQYVCVVRHGLDVACSTREWVERSESHPRELLPYVARHARPLEAYTHAWVDATGAIADLARRRPDQVSTLRYESLVESPAEELERLFAFLGIEFSQELLDRAFATDEALGFSDWKSFAKPGIEGSSIGRWQRLSGATVSELGILANPTLKEWGYEPVPIDPPRSDAEARRRYELGLQFQASRRDESRG